MRWDVGVDVGVYSALVSTRILGLPLGCFPEVDWHEAPDTTSFDAPVHPACRLPGTLWHKALESRQRCVQQPAVQDRGIMADGRSSLVRRGCPMECAWRRLQLRNTQCASRIV